MKRISEMTDAQLARRNDELAYHLLECAIDPEHPATRMNKARWEREFKQVHAACRRRGLVKS